MLSREKVKSVKRPALFQGTCWAVRYPQPSHDTLSSWPSVAALLVVWAHQSHGVSPTGRHTQRSGHENHEVLAWVRWRRRWRRWRPAASTPGGFTTSSSRQRAGSVVIVQRNIAILETSSTLHLSCAPPYSTQLDTSWHLLSTFFRHKRYKKAVMSFHPILRCPTGQTEYSN